ncbi:Transmembrane protein 104 like protein [Argiope bruennichi]|uniref:Transmembrane protein 104 like protein n=1 Tax=Argiope bruennichi TaxID=94029 RepID=A0A8T0EI12_ARGBR|nr:Transmembrane protein 104 like protein [Argiope bruennichi]
MLGKAILPCFVTVTFVTESMAAANAMVHSHTVRHLKKVMKTEDVGTEDSSQQLVEHFLTDEVITNSLENEKVPLLLSNSVDTISETSAEYFNITERIEMGKMALLFFNRAGVNIFYLCIAVYLYGDLAIYAAAVSKSLRDVSCTYSPKEAFCNDTLNSTVQCWGNLDVSRGDAYRIFVAGFLLFLGPFKNFFKFPKKKYREIFYYINEVVSFFHNDYSCSNCFSQRLFVADYLLILLFYVLLSFTGIFAFEHPNSLYTLNFEPQNCNSSSTGESIIPENFAFLRYFLALFPVFTLSTNFPIIAITLRNNLKSVCLKDNKRYSFFVDRILFPLLAIIPPIAIALVTEDLTVLVGVTGSYAGAAIQMFPTPKIDTVVISVILVIFLFVSNTFAEESDLPAPKSTETPLYKFYYAIIEFLSAIADFMYYRLFGTPPD